MPMQIIDVPAELCKLDKHIKKFLTMCINNGTIV